MPGSFNACEIMCRTCGNGHVCTERAQFAAEQAADSPVAEYQHMRLLNGDRQFLHGELNRTLGGWYRVCEKGVCGNCPSGKDRNIC